MQFYEKYLDLCNSVGKSPSRVVLEVGLKKSAVTRWKAGGMPTDATAQKLADYFGCSISDLTADLEQKEMPTVSGELSNARRDLLAAVDDMTDEQVYKLLEIIKQVKSL